VAGRVHGVSSTNYKGWYQKKMYRHFFRQEAVRFGMFTPVWWEIKKFMSIGSIDLY
jgi:hypothetical protein